MCRSHVGEACISQSLGFEKLHLATKTRGIGNTAGYGSNPPLPHQSLDWFAHSLICICPLFFSSMPHLASPYSPVYLSLFHISRCLPLYWRHPLPVVSLLHPNPLSAPLPSSFLTHLFSLWCLSLSLRLPLLTSSCPPSLSLSETALSDGTQSGVLQPFTKHTSLSPLNPLRANCRKPRRRRESTVHT